MLIFLTLQRSMAFSISTDIPAEKIEDLLSSSESNPKNDISFVQGFFYIKVKIIPIQHLYLKN